MSNSAVVGLLRVLLSANAAEFEQAMAKASETTAAWSKSLNSVGKQATQVGQALTKTVTLPIVGVGGAALKMASDFESSFAGVRKTVDATEPEFAQLAEGLRNMAKEIPVNVNELNKVAEAAGQLGIKKDDIVQFTRTMADLGVTTNLTADQAATATAQIQNIFGAAGKDVDRFGAALVALGNAGASTEKDIIEMGLRIAGAGNQVGLTQAQVLGFASALSSVGINAEAGGSAISRVFLKINDAVAKGGEDLTEFARIAGMSGTEFATRFREDAAGATIAFIEGLSRLKAEGENVNATLEGVVGKNIILKDTLLRAAGAGEMLKDQVALGTKAWGENTALTKEAEERYKTFQSQLALFWGQLRDVGIELGTSLLPALRDLLTLTQPLISALATAARWFGDLPEPVRLVGVAVGGVAAAAGPVVFVFGQLASAFSAIMPVITAVGGAIAGLGAGPLLAIVGAVTGVVLAWRNWDTITTIVKNVYTAVKTWMVDMFASIVANIKARIDTVVGFFQGMYDAVVGNSYVPDMMVRIGEEFGKLQTLMVVPTKAAVAQVKSEMEGLGSDTDGVFTQLFGSSKELGQHISSIFQAAFTGGGGASGAIKAFATDTLTTLFAMIPGVGEWVSMFAGPIVEMLSRLGRHVADFFKGLFGGPSRDELNGRNLVAEFENNLIGLLTGQQKAEAGGERWKEVVIAIRDAYLAMGRTEAEALADAERLWKSSKEGAEASARVIAEIDAKMRAAGTTAEGAIDKVGRALEELPEEVRILIRGDYEGPELPRGEHTGDWSGFPHMGDGGLVTRPTMAIVGERGPEAVIPLDRMAPLGGGLTVVQHIDARESTLDSFDGWHRFGRKIARAVDNSMGTGRVSVGFAGVR